MKMCININEFVQGIKNKKLKAGNDFANVIEMSLAVKAEWIYNEKLQHRLLHNSRILFLFFSLLFSLFCSFF